MNIEKGGRLERRTEKTDEMDEMLGNQALCRQTRACII